MIAWVLALSAHALELPACHVALERPGAALPVSIPAPSSRVEATFGHTWAPDRAGVEVGLACLLLRDVPERRASVDLLALTAQLTTGALAGREVDRHASDWMGYPALTVEFDATVAGRPVRILLWQAMVGRAHLQVQISHAGHAPLPPSALAVFADLRLVGPVNERPPSEVPLSFVPWTSGDGRFGLDVPAGVTPHDVVTTLRARSVDLSATTTSWYAPGHGTFGIRRLTLPEALRAEGPAVAAEALMDGQLVPMRLTDVQRAPLDVPGGAGVEVAGRMPVGDAGALWPSRVRVLVRGERAVVLLAHGPEGEVQEPDVARVFGSLRWP